MSLSPESYCIAHSHFNFKNQKSVYQGKVRDVYDLGTELLMITSDRISAFDHILPRPIPYKGQVLNQIAIYFLEAAKQICPVWLRSSPDPNVSIGLKCEPIPIEMVIRGYIAGHAWRSYRNGARSLSGVRMPNSMKEGEEFPNPIITPTTKASKGHDMDISKAEILEQKIVDPTILNKVYEYTIALYEMGTAMARDKGLILVDTKYEFGIHDDEVILMDEIHTPDSSRYYIADGYEERLDQNLAQIQLSKEFVREWLMHYGFQGREGELMPEMPDAFVWEISHRYIELYEKITGRTFQKDSALNIEKRMNINLKDYISNNFNLLK